MKYARPQTAWAVKVSVLVKGRHWQTASFIIDAGTPAVAAMRAIKQVKCRLPPRSRFHRLTVALDRLAPLTPAP